MWIGNPRWQLLQDKFNFKAALRYKDPILYQRICQFLFGSSPRDQKLTFVAIPIDNNPSLPGY